MSTTAAALISDFVGHIDFQDPALLISLASIAFNPIFWNIVARSEYRNKTLTRLAGGRSLYGCYGLAATIFSLGIFRDILYEKALRAQPTWAVFEEYDQLTTATAIASFLTGNVLVLSSMWALGITGTYLGDYFGILMDDIVTSFPFNVCNNPMYYGSSLSFLGTALWFKKPAGVFVTAFVFVMYIIALRFEEPFTAGIYAKREQERRKESAKNK